MKINALVVDNNPVLLKLVSTILTLENCTVRTAENGLHALEILEDFDPDIVFTDLIMPQVSGEQLCNILRRTKKHKNTFIVVLSATVMEDRERILREIDCDFCIAKGNLKEIRIHIVDSLKAFQNKEELTADRDHKNAKIPEGLQPSAVTGELLYEKRHIATIMANLYEGIIDLNKEGKVVAANRAALDILACREEDLIGESITEICDWGEFQNKIEEWKTTQLVGRDFATLEIFEQNPLNMNDKILTVSFIPVADKDAVFALCIIRDISRQFRAEEESRELDNAVKLIKKMDAMSCMAGGVAHDFNNLLTVIYGNLDIVTIKGEKFDKIERNDLIHQAKMAALAAVDLTRQISGFSNFGIVSREQVGIEKLVRDTVTSFFKDKSGNHHIESHGIDRMVYVDSGELKLAICNVLQNAFDAAEYGNIGISLDFDEFSTRQLIHGQYVPAGRYARIDIQDSGKGIDKEHLFRIFDPYYSTKERGFLKGMGFGLTVVYATLRNHGGYVVVDSKPGVGTTVSLYIPELQRSPDQARSDNKSPLSGQLLLLIEPDEKMGKIGTIMLEYLGLTVEVAQTRTAAITYLKNLKKDSPDLQPLVLLDLSEKQGGTADETCSLLHEINPALRIVAMGGTILDPIMENCKNHGFVAALPKPYTMDSLRHIVTAAFYS